MYREDGDGEPTNRSFVRGRLGTHTTPAGLTSHSRRNMALLLCGATARAAPPAKQCAVDDRRSAAPEGDRAALFLLAEHAVDGRATGAGDLGELFLGERDHPVAVRVHVGELGKPAQHAALGGDVEGVEQKLVLTADLGSEERDQHLADLRVSLA